MPSSNGHGITDDLPASPPTGIGLPVGWAACPNRSHPDTPRIGTGDLTLLVTGDRDDPGHARAMETLARALAPFHGHVSQALVKRDGLTLVAPDGSTWSVSNYDGRRYSMVDMDEHGRAVEYHGPERFADGLAHACGVDRESSRLLVRTLDEEHARLADRE